MGKMSMKDAQAECRRLRAKGDSKSMQQAQKLQNKFRSHPHYESDQSWIVRMQSGRQARG